jgi:hypothetical protein
MQLSKLLALSLIISSYDYRIGFVTVSEILNIFLFIFYQNKKFSKLIVISVLSLLIFYFLNGYIDLISGGFRQVEFFGFLYKYINIFITFYLFYSIKIDCKISRNVSVMIITFWTLWVLREFSINTELTRMGFPRPHSVNIPPDSHLFGFLAGIVGLYAVITVSGLIQKFLMGVIVFGLLILIGARTPIVLLSVSLFMALFLNLFIQKKIKSFFIFLFSIMCMFFMLFLVEIYNLGDRYRSVSFGMDDSVVGRFNKMLLVLENATATLPYGIGYSRLSFTGRWVDGIIPTLVLDFGLYIGLFLIFALIAVSLILSINFLRQEKFYTCVALNYIVGAQFVTEYLLTARGCVLSIGFFFAMYTFEKNRKHSYGR